MSKNQNNMDYMSRRRSSVTPMPMNNIFPRANCAPFPGPITTAAAQDQQRRLSILSLGLSANSPSKPTSFPYDGRRSSTTSVGSESVEENAVDEDDYGRSIPTTPLGRRMSLGAQAIRSTRGGNGPSNFCEGSNFSFPEHFRNRAESSITQSQRPTFSGSPTSARNTSNSPTQTDIPPPSVVPPATLDSQVKKPDAFQERMLKGDFYMD